VGKDWKNRIVGSGTADPEQLLANPFNYRRHPGMQREALRDQTSLIPDQSASP
jgi:hypothetical protein